MSLSSMKWVFHPILRIGVFGHEIYPLAHTLFIRHDPAMRKNVTTPEGKELGTHLARFADVEVARGEIDRRCSTCAFRAGDHLANGSVETLMTALKCVMEREVFWCHEHPLPCGGWILLRHEQGNIVKAPWDSIDGADELPAIVKKPPEDR